MEFIRKTHNTKVATASIREGADYPFFTKEEKEAQDAFILKNNQPFELRTQKTDVVITTYLRMTNEYLEKKMGLTELLSIIRKLSDENGAASKKIYTYYEKMGTNRLLRDISGYYKYQEKYDLTDANNRKRYYTQGVLYHGHSTYYLYDATMEWELANISTKHLTRCIAILLQKGYITKSNLKVRTYRNKRTFYQLTAKAEKHLNGGH